MLLGIETDISHPIEQDENPPEHGDLIHRSPLNTVRIYKRRFGIQRLNISQSSGFRLIYALVNISSDLQEYLVIPIHLYSKSYGKKTKPNLTDREKANVDKIADDLEKNIVN